ncbi:MAG: hypothetical protein EOP00_23290 [Pedobacter sp.]|nr:MAG: hypothetical protein EOP00_23290 [Pedobacter sp.]
MSTLKKIYYKACSTLPMSLFSSGGPAGLLLPYHHTVSNEQLQHIAHLYSYKNIEQFNNDLDFLLKYYKAASVEEVTKAISNKTTLPKGSFLLTFDDGFREVHDIIAPLLEKKGVPAIFFINPAFIDNRELFYRCKISILIGALKKNEHNILKLFSDLLQIPGASKEQVVEALKKINQNNATVLDSIAEKINYSFEDYLQEQQPFLTKEKVIALHNKGFTIGAHSINHPYYKLLDVEEQVKQTIESCNYVKAITGTNECHFSFPHSDEDISQQTISIINNSNNGILFGIQNQKEERKNNMLHIHLPKLNAFL